MWAQKVAYSILILCALFAAFLVVAVLAPKDYQGEITVYMPDRRLDIWRNLSSLETIKNRRPDVARVEQLSESYESVVWKEHLRDGGSRTLRVLDREAPSYFKVERFESTDGITGTWEYELTPGDGTTQITIRETSFNDNLWARGWHTIIGRNILLKREVKSLRVGLFNRLIDTP